MATYSQNFQNHAFQSVWENCTKKIEEIILPVDANADLVQNHARMVKAILYVDSLLQCCDPDLIPFTMWDNFENKTDQLNSQLTSFETNKTISYLSQANTSIDTLIQYLSPHVISGKGAAQAMGRAISAQSKIVQEVSERMNETVLEQLKNAEENADEIQTTLENSKRDADIIEAFRIRLLVDDEVTSTSSEIESLVEKIKEIEGRAEEFSDTVFGDDEDDENSIRYKVDTAFKDISESKSETEVELNLFDEMMQGLKESHAKILGVKNDEGVLVNGLENKYDDLISKIVIYEDKQKEIHKTITKQMNELLKGVTSAGLASSFQKQRLKYEKPIKNYGRLFVLSIGLLVLIGLSTFIGYDKGNGFSWSVPDGLIEMTIATFMRAPIAAPIVWLTVFSAARRAENRRLEEEYAHKETIARAYNGFKEQVDAISNEDSTVLAAQLLEAAIASAAFNASQTLDKPNKDEFSNYNNLDVVLKEVKKIKDINKVIQT